LAADPSPGRAAAVAAYKTLLRAFIERRPSGLRGRLALALGKHKSFVSQITNPLYSVPIPACDLPLIIDICRLSAAERDELLALYRAAHPQRQQRPPAPAPAPGSGPHELRIALPAFRSLAVERQIEALILEVAGRIIRIAQAAEAGEGRD
jgi:hypothetical protein